MNQKITQDPGPWMFLWDAWPPLLVGCLWDAWPPAVDPFCLAGTWDETAVAAGSAECHPLLFRRAAAVAAADYFVWVSSCGKNVEHFGHFRRFGHL